MIEPIINILIEPFDTLGPEVIVWFVGCSTLQVLIGGIHAQNTEVVEEMIEEMNLWECIAVIGVFGPVREELLFRGLPAVLFAWNPIAVFFGSVFWALGHEGRQLVILPVVPFYAKLWAGGFWKTAIAIHISWNTVLVLMAKTSG